MNREERLKSYHARKVAERRLHASRSKEGGSGELTKSTVKTVATIAATTAATKTTAANSTATAASTATATTKHATPSTPPPPSSSSHPLKIRSETKPIDEELVKLFVGRRRRAKAEMNSDAVVSNTTVGGTVKNENIVVKNEYHGGAIKSDVSGKDKIDSVDPKNKIISGIDKQHGSSTMSSVKMNGSTNTTTNSGSTNSAISSITTKKGSKNNNTTSSNSRKALQMYGKKKIVTKSTMAESKSETNGKMEKKQGIVGDEMMSKERVISGEEKDGGISTNGADADDKGSNSNMTRGNNVTNSHKSKESIISNNANQHIQPKAIDNNPPSSPKAREKTVRFLSPNPQCSPPRHRLAEDQGKGVEEAAVKGQVKVDREEACAEEDADFLLFIAGLKREVAGDHTELWTSFQSLLNRPSKPLTTDKKKRRRMDPQTQASLTLIHKGLAKEERIKNGFMRTSSQLVNDRGVKKEREEKIALEAANKAKVEVSAEAVEVSVKEVSLVKEIQSKARGDASIATTISAATERSKDKPTDDNKEKKPTWINSYKKKKSLYLSAYASSNPHKDKSPNISPASSSDSSSLKPASTSSFQSFRSNSSRSSQCQSRKSEVKKPSWLEALKKKQKSLRSKQPLMEERMEEPMVFQLSPRKRPKYTPPSSPDGDANVAPWANVKLRSAKKSVVEDSSVSKGGVVELAEGNVNDGDTTHQKKEEPLPNLFSIGDVIHLNSLPATVFAPQETETFPLSSRDKIVIVGRDAILTATRLSEQKASVQWWSHRCEIRSLTLNVDATGADLALTKGSSMPLAFPSADVCLNFAQFFLRGPSKPEKEDTEPPNPDVAALTAEEESLLDNYRKFSESDRMKLKLTCLSPRGDPEELEVNLSPRVLDQAAVNRSVPEKYGKMLQMGIPPDAVRHKMTMEGVDPEIVKLVVDPEEVQDTNSGEDGSSLSAEEEVIVAKYRKMLKMGVPPDGVRHKMTTEGVAAKIIDAVFNESDSKEETNKLSDEEEAIATKYRKMLKMGVPSDGVRHKMTTEGVDPKIIDAVLAPPQSEQESGSKQQQLSGEEEVIASKYRRMLKMRVPLDAVKHKMTQDAVDLKIVSVIVSEATGDNSEVPPTPLVPAKKAVSEALVLTQEEEKEASKYRMMIKVCIPKDAIRHEMKKEGVSDKIVESVLGKEWLENQSVPQTASKPKEFNRKTIQFHWTTSNLPPELLQQSIFGKVDQKKRKISTINPEEADIKKLEELFQKRDNSAAAKKKASGVDDAGGGMAKLLDLTRANNIAISLKAFNDFTFRSLAETINDLDPDRKIVGERVQFIPNLLPTPKEIAAIKKFKGDDDKLITAELFFKQLVSIKRIEDKVQVMKTMHFFEDHIEEVREGFKTLQVVCNQVLNSEKLLQVLQMVLNIGNLMNEGTLNGGVDAFKFESLSKLSQTKSANGKMTVLDYIVETFILKGERDVINLLTDFPDIQDSSRLSIGDLIGEMNSLRKDYNLCKSELSKMKNDQSSKRVTRSMAKKIDDEGEVEDPRKALFAAIKARAPKEEKAPPADPRQALFAAIKNRKQDTSEGSDETDTCKTEYTPGVQRLQDFLNHSKTVLSLAESDQDAAIRACKGLAVYCGEGGGERTAAPLLQILCEFALSLEAAMKKYDARVEAEAKRAAKLAREKDKENRTKATPTPRKLLRASAFQPHVGVTDKVRVLSPLRQETSLDAREALFNAIKSKENKPKRRTVKPKKETSTSKQALFADIKSGKKPSEVKESRILLVNKMLQEAPANVKRDFLRGVTYYNTDDPILRKIYEKESYSPKSNN